MRRPLHLLATLVALGGVAAPAPAVADETSACSDAFDRSQRRRDEGKLLDARNLLRVCQAPSCSPTQQRLCAQWLGDVEKRLPSFVLAAKDGSGADLVEVKVTMDGVQVATKLDGRAIEVDPGPHSFVFELADGTRAETKAVADERGQGKLVSVSLGQPRTPAATAVTPAAPASPDATSGGSPLATVGLVAGGVGVVGIALGAVFGAEALSTKGSHCSNGLCDPGSASNVYSQATVSTVGFIAGGILLAGGVTLFLLAPKSGSEPAAASVSVAPMVGSSGGGLQLAGRW